MARDESLAHLAALSAAVDLPVNADFEYGFAMEPDEVAVNVGLVVATGVCGLSVEDTRPDGGLHELPLAVERIRAARAAIDATGQDVLLVGRAEIILQDGNAIGKAIDKLVAFADAGADCLYAPGARKKEDISAIVRAVAPKPVNVLMWGPDFTLAEMEDLGVRRISVGGALARVAWGAAMATAEKMRAGSFEGLTGAASGKTMNAIFSGFDR